MDFHCEGKEGNFYRMDKEGNFKKWRSDIGVSNGLTWSEDNTKMYFIDSFEYGVT